MVKSIKGVEIDMEGLRKTNEKAIALGNARMNARGDLLGKNGKVLKTKEQMSQEYNKAPISTAAKNVPLSTEVQKMLETPPGRKVVAQNKKDVKVENTKTEDPKEE